MDITSSSIDHYQSGQVDLTGPSTLSDSKPDSKPRQASHSDDDVILASSRPKKRSGRTKFKETRHPVYRGVRKRNTDRWVCELREPTKQTRIWLGTYPTAEMAARAHDVAALALRGQSACLNFADSVWRLPVPTSLEPKDIRKTAMEAAEAFRPSDSGTRGVAGAGKIDNAEAFDGGSPSEEGILGMMNTTPENLYYNDEVAGMINTTLEGDYYHDQEAMFDMPGLMQDMAHGMMLSPPRSSNANSSWHYDDTTDSELPLWSHSL